MKRNYRLVMGKNCLKELLKNDPKRIVEVYTCNQSDKDELQQKLQKLSIPIKKISKKMLDNLVDSTSHQSYAAAVKERGRIELKDFFYKKQEADSSLVVMLDSIFDPQNFGAILRACECFGVDLVIYSKNRGCEITPVVSKTSSGASEFVPIIKVSNLADTLNVFKDEGYLVVSSALAQGSQSLFDFEFPKKTLLIFGSEGKGIQPLLLKKSDFIVQIPMLGKIDSLNVSQAASVFLSHYKILS